MKNTDKLNRFVSWMQAKNMARSTIKTYRHFLVTFFTWANEDSCRISGEKIQSFILSIPSTKSFSYKNQAINAIRLYFIVMEHKKLDKINLPRPKNQQFIPNILSVDQMQKVIFNTKNIKHQAILFTIYDNGLRRSELINLTIMDVRTKCDVPHLVIREAKHHSSRLIPMSDKCRELIKEYYIAYKPKKYLFEGPTGEKYSETSIANILKAALDRENIKLRIRVHDLRHSFATHCLANGTDIHHLSQILGHRSVKTTEKFYSHLTFKQLLINRPCDNLNLKIKQYA